MNCSYHPAVESRGGCSLCNKPLCGDCTCTVKGKAYCQDCLAQSAEWLAGLKGRRIPADTPQRAAWCALIPGMGAIYNNEYLKAVTYFAVFACLMMMGDRFEGMFGFGAIVFLIFTMFDAYRTAERRMLALAEPGAAASQDKAIVGWGIFLMFLGALFLLHNLLPSYFVNRLWPLTFILLGGFLVYYALQNRDDHSDGMPSRREDL